MFSDNDLENLKKFIGDNTGILTAIGVFGALMSYLAINKESLPFGTFLPFLSIIIFLFFVVSFIKIINKLRDNEKGDYIDSLKYLLIIFSALLIGYTINIYSNIIEGIIKLIIIIGAFLFFIKTYEKYERLLKRKQGLTFVISLVILSVYHKIDQCNLLNLDKEGIVYVVVGIFAIFGFLFLVLFPFFDIVSKLISKIKEDYKKIIKWVLIVLVVGILFCILVFVIDLFVKFDIINFILQLLSNIKEIVYKVAVKKWC